MYRIALSYGPTKTMPRQVLASPPGGHLVERNVNLLFMFLQMNFAFSPSKASDGVEPRHLQNARTIANNFAEKKSRLGASLAFGPKFRAPATIVQIARGTTLIVD